MCESCCESAVVLGSSGMSNRLQLFLRRSHSHNKHSERKDSTVGQSNMTPGNIYSHYPLMIKAYRYQRASFRLPPFLLIYLVLQTVLIQLPPYKGFLLSLLAVPTSRGVGVAQP